MSFTGGLVSPCLMAYLSGCFLRRREFEAARAKKAEKEESRRHMEAERRRLQNAVAPYTDMVRK